MYLCGILAKLKLKLEPKMALVSISRLHKLADRLKLKIAELNTEALALASAVAVRTAPTPQTFARCEVQSAEVLVKFAEAERLSREVSRIRAIISTNNERLGVSAKLGLQDVLNRQLAQLKTITARATEDTIDDLELGQVVSEYGTAVNPISREKMAQFKTIAERLQREIFGLSDDVAEANAMRVELELSADIAALITG